MRKVKIDNKQERDIESNALLNTDVSALQVARQRKLLQQEQRDLLLDVSLRVIALEAEVKRLGRQYKKSCKN